MGALARPGATAGYVEALLSCKKNHPEIVELNSVRKCLDLVARFIRSKRMRFSFHTDQHADPQPGHETHSGERPILGCGHCAKAIEHAADYGVNFQDITELIELMRKSATDESDFEMVALNGDHAEQAALVITGSTHTVNARDTAKDRQFLIYDKARDDVWITEFVEFLLQQKIYIGSLEYRTILDDQKDTTLALIAGGKKVYSVNVDSDKPEILFADTIPTIDELRKKEKQSNYFSP